MTSSAFHLSPLPFPLHCSIPLQSYFPQLPRPFKDRSALLSNTLSRPLQFSYHSNPPKAPSRTLNSPSSVWQAFSSLLHDSRLSPLSLPQAETFTHLNQMGVLLVSCENSYSGNSFIFSPLDVFPVTAFRSERHQWPKFGKAC